MATAEPEKRWPASLASNDDLLAWAAMAAIFFALASSTWGHWGDFQIDCGRELYVPIQLLKGRLLYRDLWYSYGPLTPYLQALLVWWFGVQLETFFGLGLVLTVAISSLMYVLARRVVPPAAAFVVATLCLSQAFRPFLFNYVFPYSYAAVVALALSLGSLFFLFRFADDRNYRDLLRAGLAAGLALLSKQEFGAASLVAIALIIVWDSIEARSPTVLSRQALAVLPGVLLASAVYGWFFWKVPPSLILRDFAISPSSPFMKTLGPRWIARNGFRFVPREQIAMLASAIFALASWYLLGRFLGDAKRWWLIPLATIALLISIPEPISVQARTLVIALIGMISIPAGLYWFALVLPIAAFTGSIPDLDASTRRIVIVLAVFAIILGARVMAEMTGDGYAIYYGPPVFLAYMIAAAAAFSEGARNLAASKRKRILVLVLVADALWILSTPLRVPYFYRGYRFETSIGTFYTDRGTAEQVPRLVSFVKTATQAGKRTMILPELPMLYVLTGTESPSRWYELVPGMLDEDDQRRLIADADSKRVEYIVVTNRNTAEYGVPYFGLDYGKIIHDWIDANFEPAGQFGKFTRVRGAEFSAELFERRHSSPNSPAPFAGAPQR